MITTLEINGRAVVAGASSSILIFDEWRVEYALVEKIHIAHRPVMSEPGWQLGNMHDDVIVNSVNVYR